MIRYTFLLYILGMILPTWCLANASIGCEATGPNRLSLAAYSVEPMSNYGGGWRSNRALTDQVIPSSKRWADTRWIGWSKSSPVNLKFVLNSEAEVGCVEVIAGQDTNSGVRLPTQVLIYGKNSSGSLYYLGTSTLGGGRPEQASGGVVAVSFPSIKLRELTVVIFSGGPYLFVGEVRAFSRGRTAVSSFKRELINEKSLPDSIVFYRRQAVQALLEPKPQGRTAWERTFFPIDLGQSVQAEHGCLVDRIVPWVGHDAYRRVNLSPADAPLSALVGGEDIIMYRIRNATQGVKKIDVNVQQDNKFSYLVSTLAYVQALNFSWVPDVVVPLRELSIPPATETIILLRVSPETAGRFIVSGSLSCGSNKKSFAVAMNVLNETGSALQGNLWAYLDDTLSIASGDQCHTTSQLRRYGVTVGVIPPRRLANLRNRQSAKSLSDQFSNYRSMDRILLYLDVRSPPWPSQSLEDHKGFLYWWKSVEAAANIAGVSKRLALYPLDEPSITDIYLLFRFKSVVRSAGIDVPLFGTLERSSVVLSAFYDIVQLRKPTRNLVRLVRLLGVSEVHSYSTEPDGKLIDPSQYWLQGWRAFAMGLDGVGFWSAWQSSGTTETLLGWNPFGKREIDFGVLFRGADGCLTPSIRLLAWQRGIEEARMARYCETRLGERAAQQLKKIISERSLTETQEMTKEFLRRCIWL